MDFAAGCNKGPLWMLWLVSPEVIYAGPPNCLWACGQPWCFELSWSYMDWNVVVSVMVLMLDNS